VTVAETIAERIEAIDLALRRRTVQAADRAAIHAECNGYLVALRSGCRRRSHGRLRERIRRVRAAVTTMEKRVSA
jgi:hypothetical protein